MTLEVIPIDYHRGLLDLFREIYNVDIDGPFYAFVIYDDEQLGGYVLCKSNGELLQVLAAVSFGKGIYTPKVLTAIEAWAKDRGFSSVDVFTVRRGLISQLGRRGYYLGHVVMRKGLENGQ